MLQRRRIVIENLPPGFTDQRLFELFSGQNEVRDAFCFPDVVSSVPSLKGIVEFHSENSRRNASANRFMEIDGIRVRLVKPLGRFVTISREELDSYFHGREEVLRRAAMDPDRSAAVIRDATLKVSRKKSLRIPSDVDTSRMHETVLARIAMIKSDLAKAAIFSIFRAGSLPSRKENLKSFLKNSVNFDDRQAEEVIPDILSFRTFLKGFRDELMLEEGDLARIGDLTGIRTWEEDRRKLLTGEMGSAPDDKKYDSSSEDDSCFRSYGDSVAVSSDDAVDMLQRDRHGTFDGGCAVPPAPKLSRVVAGSTLSDVLQRPVCSASNIGGVSSFTWSSSKLSSSSRSSWQTGRSQVDSHAMSADCGSKSAAQSHSSSPISQSSQSLTALTSGARSSRSEASSRSTIFSSLGISITQTSFEGLGSCDEDDMDDVEFVAYAHSSVAPHRDAPVDRVVVQNVDGCQNISPFSTEADSFSVVESHPSTAKVNEVPAKLDSGTLPSSLLEKDSSSNSSRSVDNADDLDNVYRDDETCFFSISRESEDIPAFDSSTTFVARCQPAESDGEQDECIPYSDSCRFPDADDSSSSNSSSDSE
eukprot:ANDGO_06287.mRNA.1 hypothetical protein